MKSLEKNKQLKNSALKQRLKQDTRTFTKMTVFFQLLHGKDFQSKAVFCGKIWFGWDVFLKENPKSFSAHII